jgi:enamine deaminase RidA (YjgF/YER057c/UK114 family)
MSVERQLVSSGTVWEGIVGYSRAVRVDRFVSVAGTTATGDDGSVIGKGDPGAQTDFILQKIERALREAGAGLHDVVRTRIFLTNVDDWEAVGRVHGRYFAAIRPANTLVEVSALVGGDYLVEIEADAVIGNRGSEISDRE